MIELDARDWATIEDFYAALLPKLEAPAWHGRNLNALDDSIFGGDINGVEPPFCIVVNHTNGLSPDMRAFMAEVEEVFADGRTETRQEAYIELRSEV